MESARRGSQIASDGIKRSQDGKPVEGAALFGSGAASASIGASAAIAGGRTQSGAIASKRSARDWSGPLKVSDDTVVAQPVPQVPFEPTQPPKPEPAPEATPEPQAQ